LTRPQSSVKRGALFLDRDGVLIAETGDYVWEINDARIEPGAIALLQLAAGLQLPVFIVTNQGGIGRGLYSSRHVEYLHRYIEARLFTPLKLRPVWLYCPHHPSSGRCFCRKPSVLLFERAVHRYGISAKRSAMVGDQARDLVPARELGIHAVWLNALTQNAPSEADAACADHEDCAIHLNRFYQRGLSEARNIP